MHAQHLQATHSAPVVLVGLADARSGCPRCCRLPRPKGVWTLPFEIARLRPERPSLIKPRPALPFSWARWTRRERDCSALFRCRTQPCPQVCPCQRDSASRNDTNGKPKKTRQFAILIIPLPKHCAASGGCALCTSSPDLDHSWRRLLLAVLEFERWVCLKRRQLTLLTSWCRQSAGCKPLGRPANAPGRNGGP